MANLRNALLIAVLAATAVTAIAGYFVVGGSPARLLVDAGLAGALFLIVSFMLSPTVKRVDAMVEALRALARGDRGQRVNPDDFAGLGEVARAMNEVAASLTENDDPNLGPVKSSPHPSFRPRPKALDKPAGDKPVDDAVVENDPALGPVRVLKKKDDKPAEQTMGEAMSEAIQMAKEKKEAQKNGDSRPPPDRPEKAAPSNDTAVDAAPRSDVGGDVQSAEPVLPTRQELEALFSEFVAAKKSHDENVADLELEAFAQTIQGECERLIAAHQCKGVRFEVTVMDGEVSLRPRLLR